MEPGMEIALLLVVGLITGIAGGLFGIGGGTIIVPILIFMLGYGQLQAQGTSLAAMLLPVGIFGVLKYRKAGIFNLKCSLLIGFGLLIGAWPGAKLAVFMPKELLKLIYAFFLLYVSWRFIEPVKGIQGIIAKIRIRQSDRKMNQLAQQSSQLPQTITNAFDSNSATAQTTDKQEPVKLLQKPIDNWYWMLLLGFAGGIASGLFGIGGGAIIVPFLALFFRFDHQDARVISLGALLPPVGVFGMIPYIQKGHIHIITALPVAAGIMAGAFLGAVIGVKVPKKLIKMLYGFFLVWIAFDYLFQSQSFILTLFQRLSDLF